jgi:hypothetical protein
MSIANLKSDDAAFRIYTDPDDRQLKRPTNFARGTLPPIEIQITPPRVEPTLSTDLERTLIAILTADREAGETIEMRYKRKEHELGSAFAGLTLVQARALHARLLAAREDDVLALHFGRLIEARRVRLLAFLVMARR